MSFKKVLSFSLIFFALLISTAHADDKNFFEKEKVYDSIVKIENKLTFYSCDLVFNKDDEAIGTKNCNPKTVKFSVGSGFSLSKSAKRSKQIATAGHLCELSKKAKKRMKVRALFSGKKIGNIRISSYTVLLDGGSEYKATLRAVDRELDACLLQIKGTTLPSLQMASERPQRAEEFWSAGAPLGINGKDLTYLTSGHYIGSKKVRGKVMDWYSLPSVGGSSGSTILNEDGEVVGLISLGIPQFKEISISPKFSELDAFFGKHLNK